MRVLIQTLGSAGDTHPFIGVGKALRKRGHDVVLLANEVFAEAVESAGLDFVQIGDAGHSYEPTRTPTSHTQQRASRWFSVVWQSPN